MRCHWIAACVVAGLLALTLRADDGVKLTKKNGVTEGVLKVAVAETDASKPAQVDYWLDIHTSPEMDVETPQLIGAAEVWTVQAFPREVKAAAGAQNIRFHLQLEQANPGIQPLPGVKVRFHTHDKDDWSDLVWTDILKEPRPFPPLSDVKMPPPAPSDALLWWTLGILASLFVAGGVVFWAMRSKKTPLPLPPTEWALRELNRIEGLGLAGPDESGWYPAEISSVIRHFLSERYGLPAQQQTTAEFLQALRDIPELSEELQRILQELLERCDLAKFAALRTPPVECRRLAGLARGVVQQTVSPSVREETKLIVE